MGLYGSDIFLRLSENNRAELMKIKGASNFEPMKGRAMKDYIVIPRSWKTTNDREKIMLWVSRALDDTANCPKRQRKAKFLPRKSNETSENPTLSW